MPPKNIATPASGRKLAAEPIAGCGAISNIGAPMIAITTTKFRRFRYARSLESKYFATSNAVKIFMNSDG